MVTVESAVALCAFIAVLALLLAGLSAVLDQIRCTDAAREAARLVARNEPDQARQAATAIAPAGATVAVHTDADTVTVVVTAAPGGGLLPGVHVRGEAYAVIEPTGSDAAGSPSAAGPDAAAGPPSVGGVAADGSSAAKLGAAYDGAAAKGVAVDDGAASGRAAVDDGGVAAASAAVLDAAPPGVVAEAAAGATVKDADLRTGGPLGRTGAPIAVGRPAGGVAR